MNAMLACCATFLATVLAMPFVMRLARSIGAVDVPRDRRRMHRHSTPRAGGLAWMGAVIVGAVLFLDGDALILRAVAGCVLLLAVGLLDDIKGLAPRSKLIAQLMASVIVCGLPIDFGRLLSVLWIALLCNAHNFIDGMDGLLCGCTALESTALALCLVRSREGKLASLALLVLSASLGFWIYNRHPAKTFAGDCGSCTVGYLLGVLSLPLFLRTSSPIQTLSPFLIFALPIADMTAAVGRRILRGRSPFCADRGHLHHRLYDAGFSQTLCVRILHLLAMLAGMIGVLLQIEGERMLAAAGCLLLALAMRGVRKRALRGG